MVNVIRGGSGKTGGSQQALAFGTAPASEGESEGTDASNVSEGVTEMQQGNTSGLNHLGGTVGDATKGK